MRTNSNSPDAAFVFAQANLLNYLNDRYATGRKIEADALGEAIVWAKNPEDAKKLVRAFQADSTTKIDFLSDLTAYDNKDGEDGEGRFVLVYQLYSLEKHIRVRVKCLLAENEQAETLVDIWEGANWLEREVFDMFGITFRNHPNLRRIMMDERFSGHPLRKEYPVKQREGFNNNVPLHMGANPIEVSTHINPSEESK